MSVFHRGGSYIHHRLSKLYSDTKRSYETATVATRRDDDPDLASLQKEYRIQKDRLLAWGLDWSDSKTTQFPDVQIDDSVDQAGFSDVVGYIMSTIQDLLMQSEKLQKAFEDEVSNTADQSPPGNFTGDKDDSTSGSLSIEHLQKSRLLLDELTACIDYLFKLSDTRRAARKGSKDVAISKESFIQDLQEVQSRTSYQSEASRNTESDSQLTRIATSPSPRFGQQASLQLGKRSSQRGTSTSLFQPAQNQQTNLCARALQINESAVSALPDPITDDTNPPTYDAAVGASVTRSLAWIDGSLLSESEREQLSKSTKLVCRPEEKVQIIIETLPFGKLNQTRMTKQDIELSMPAHLVEDGQNKGILRERSPELIKYFKNYTQNQHVAIYQMPKVLQRPEYRDNLYQTEILNSLFPISNDSSENHMPSLEDRFRLAFDLATSVFQFQTSNQSHGNINSSNVLVLSKREGRTLRHRCPMLMSQLNLFKGMKYQADETFSSMIYRHPQAESLDTSETLWVSDVYSVGLVLLEIGLWTPLRRLWKSKYDRETFKSRIRSVYTQKLASRCGTAYMEAVNLCIDAAENTASTAAKVLPVAYTSNILQILSRCCAIDIQGEDTGPIINVFQELAKQERESKLLENRSQASDTRQLNAPRSPSQLISSPRTSNDATQTNEPLPVSSSGPESGKVLLKKWDTIEISQSDLDQWNNSLMPRLSRLLQQILGESSESCSASLMMVGKSPETAKTTICIQCTSVDRVRKALKENFKCKKGWGLVVLRGDVSRSKRPRRRDTKAKGFAKNNDQADACAQVDSCYQQRPLGGASIGAYRDFEHLPPVSFGGTVIVDGEAYGMTVHHMLDTPEEGVVEQQAVQRSAAIPSRALEDLAYVGSVSDTFHMSFLELSQDEALGFDDSTDVDDDFWFSDMADLTEDESENDDDEDDASSIGDVDGIDPTETDEDLIVTQPAIDDVEDDFFPSIEDRDDDHLSSHALGYIYASSGIRRVNKAGVKHEVDWALIKVNEDRLPVKNSFPSSRSQKQPPLTLRKVTPTSSFPYKPVLCQGRTSGLQGGRINPALALVKMYGRRSFSSSWCVDGGFGIPGDSGAWVFDPVDQSLCGHVLAWGNRSKVAFIAPMEVLFEDMEKRLGNKVELPTEDILAEKEPLSQRDKETVRGDEYNSSGDHTLLNKNPTVMQAHASNSADTDLPPRSSCSSSTSSTSTSSKESLSDKLSIDLDLSTFQNLSLDRNSNKTGIQFRKDVQSTATTSAPVVLV